MSETATFEPAVRNDGTLDPLCLERAGQRWVDEWLERRLSGFDRWFPIDPRYGEDPESLIVGIVQDAGLDHPATAMIGRSAQRLLDRARALAHSPPTYLPALLRLCQRVKLPWTSDWFTEEIRNLAAAPALVEKRWSGDLLREILLAATFQAPALPGTAASGIWPKLLRELRYATLAFLSFGSSIEARASRIAEWWQAAPPEERSRELRQILFLGLKNEGEERVRAALEKFNASWQVDLRKEVDEALQRHGAEKLFDTKAAPAQLPFYTRLEVEPPSAGGLVRFAKTVGRRLGIDEEVRQKPWPLRSEIPGMPQQLEEMKERRKAAALVKLVSDMGFNVDDLGIRVDDEKVIITGTVDTQEVREKVVLLIGNVEGIGSVDDRLRIRNSKPESTFYEVRPGDTLSKIAKEFYGDASKYHVVFEANRPMLADPDGIYPGQRLRIPDGARIGSRSLTSSH